MADFTLNYDGEDINYNLERALNCGWGYANAPGGIQPVLQCTPLTYLYVCQTYLSDYNGVVNDYLDTDLDEDELSQLDWIEFTKLAIEAPTPTTVDEAIQFWVDKGVITDADEAKKLRYVGDKTKASGFGSISLGARTSATQRYAVCFGVNSSAEGFASIAEGNNCHAYANSSHAEGAGCNANGNFSFSTGAWNNAGNYCETSIGVYSSTDSSTSPSTLNTSKTAFVIGNGSGGSRSNAFRVTFGGSVYGLSAFNSTGADYGEYFEWEDGNPDNEDRIGHFVSLTSNGKIKIAEPNEDVIGIMSGVSSIIGNANEDRWANMYLRDVYGRFIEEDAEVDSFPDECGRTEKVIEHRYKLNPDYDATKEYVPRSERPEWDVIGLLGQMVVIDDGTCSVGSKCSVAAGGIATSGNDYRVIKRNDDTHVTVLANFL